MGGMDTNMLLKVLESILRSVAKFQASCMEVTSRDMRV
jgi:hypothetical protein